MGLNKIEREINPQTSYYPWHTAPTDHSNISYYPSIRRQTPIQFQAFFETGITSKIENIQYVKSTAKLNIRLDPDVYVRDDERKRCCVDLKIHSDKF